MEKEIKEYRHIINTHMKLGVKKELLTRVIIQLDGLTFEENISDNFEKSEKILNLKKQRKLFINKIQYILHILDNIN